MEVDDPSLDEVATRHYGDCAVTTARWKTRGTAQGHPIPEATRVTLVTVKQRRDWHAAGIHLSFIDRAGPARKEVPEAWDSVAVASHPGTMARAETPEALYATIEDGFNRGDLDPVVAAYEDDAALVVPRDGDIARGRDAIRAATAAVFALQPEMTLEFVRKVEADKMAMTHGRWRLAVTSPDGERSEMSVAER